MELSACETQVIFSELEKIMNLRPRKQQIGLACQIEYCLGLKKHLIAEAPTGVGKSLAYLIPAILFSKKNKRKVVIATASKDLQKQLAYKDLPMLQKILPFSFNISLGSENYICGMKLSHGLQLGLFGGSEDVTALEQIAALQLRNPDATFLDCDFPISQSLRQMICRDSHSCALKCSARVRCAYTQAVKSQHKSDIIVTNHHKILHLVKNDSRNLKDVGAIVFDECHRLEDIATAVFSERLESKKIMVSLKELHNVRSNSGIIAKLQIPKAQKEVITEAVEAVKVKLHELYESAQIDKQIVEGDEECLRQLQASLGRIETLLIRSKIDILQHYSAKIADFIGNIDAILGKADNIIYWKEVGNRTINYTATPLSVSKLLSKKLFRSNKITTIHVSATISTGSKKKEMTFYKTTTGVLHAETMKVTSPYDYTRQAAIYIPRHMPKPNEKDYLPAAVNEIGKIIKHFSGRTLILFTSRRAMTETYDELRSKFPEFTYLKQGEASSKKLINKFRITPNSVLLGAASFWEGIDISGPCKKCVIVMRIPFDVPSDPVVVAHHEQLKKRGLLPFPTYLIPRAIIRFLQGFGRMIRSETDTAAFVIMDSRIITERYGSRILNALPKCWRLEDITDFPTT